MGGFSCLLELWSCEGEKVLHLHHTVMGLRITYCTVVIQVLQMRLRVLKMRRIVAGHQKLTMTN